MSTVDIVFLGKSMGLDVEDDDVEELVGDHNTEPTTEELQDLQREKQLPVAGELFTQEEEGKEDTPASLIKEILGKWEEMQSFIENYHPDKEVTNLTINLFNDNAGFHFRQVLNAGKNKVTGQVFTDTEVQ